MTEQSNQCCLQKLADIPCGYSTHYKVANLYSKISQCEKNTDSHLRSVHAFEHSIESIPESTLILSRLGFFVNPELVKHFQICQNHRDHYGIYWKKSVKCKHPLHGTSKSKADRGISYTKAIEIQLLWKENVSVGDGIYRGCREKHAFEVKQICPDITGGKIDSENGNKRSSSEELYMSNPSYDNVVESEAAEKEEIPRKKRCADTTDNTIKALQMTDSQVFGSDFTQTDDSQMSSQASDWLIMQMSTKDRFNKAMELLVNDKMYQPLRSQVALDWSSLQKSSRAYYISKASEAVHSVMSFIAPGQEEYILPDVLRSIQPSPVENDFLIGSILEAYYSCNHSTTQIQILSIIANKYTKEQLKYMIPGLSVSKIDAARQHAVLVGPGKEINKKPIYRDRLTRPKLSHFLEFISSPAFCQIVGFGSKLMKMSSGVEVRIPKVVRTVISTRIIQLYNDYCQVSQFNQLSRATLFRVLKICIASQKTSLRGLDNTIADGMKAAEMLEKVVRKCNTFGLTAEGMKDISSQIQRINVHMKFEIKGHISKDSNVALHCSTYALSDKTIKPFKEQCDHEHNSYCEMCSQVSGIVHIVNDAYLSIKTQVPDDLQEEIEHEISVAEKFLSDWHAHSLRTVHQELAKQSVLQNLLPNETLLIMDWAMKFIPYLHREKQTEFFGKKGISWHFSCAVTKEKDDDELSLECYIHILEDGIQDWYAMACILNHTLETLKLKKPGITRAFLKSDNAGCYHNANLMAFIQSRNKVHTPDQSISVIQYNFSEPQAGKDLCDSKTSHSKLHMLRYADEGNDILTAVDMKTALDSYSGLRGTYSSVVAVEIDNKHDKKSKVKLPGISYLNNFEFKEDSIVARKAYGIGQGQLVKNTELKLHQFQELEHFKVVKPFDNAPIRTGTVHTCIKQNLQASQVELEVLPSVLTEVVEEQHDDESPPENSSQDNNLGYPCSEPGCLREFITCRGLESHILVGNHVFERQPTGDLVKRMWIDKCHDLQSEIPSHSDRSTTGGVNNNLLSEGWGLKKPRKVVRFSPGVKDYLYTIYDNGEQTGKRPSYEDISDCLKKERNMDGTRRFKPDDWLTSGQIRSLFGTFTLKKANVQTSRGVAKLEMLDIDVSEDLDLCSVLDNLNFVDTQNQIQSLSNEIMDSC